MSQFKEKHFNNNHHSNLQPGCKAKKCGVCFPLTPAPPTLPTTHFFLQSMSLGMKVMKLSFPLPWHSLGILTSSLSTYLGKIIWAEKVRFFSYQKLAGKKKKKTMKQSKGPSRLAQFGGFNGKKQPFIIRQIPLFTSWKARFPIWRKFHVCFLALEAPYLWVIQT